MISLDNQEFAKISQFFQANQQQYSQSPNYVKSPLRNWQQPQQQTKDQEEKAKQLEEKEQELSKKAEEMQRLTQELEEQKKKMKDWEDKLKEEEKQKKELLEQEKQQLKKEQELINKQKEEAQLQQEKFEKEQKLKSQEKIAEKQDLQQIQNQQGVQDKVSKDSDKVTLKDTQQQEKEEQEKEDDQSNKKSENKKKRNKKRNKQQQLALPKASEWNKNKLIKSSVKVATTELEQNDIGDFIVVRVDNQAKSKKQQKMHLAFQPKAESNLLQVKDVDKQDGIVYEKLQIKKQNEIKKSQQKAGIFEPTEDDFPEIAKIQTAPANNESSKHFIVIFVFIAPGKAKNNISKNNQAQNAQIFNSELDFPALGEKISPKKN